MKTFHILAPLPRKRGAGNSFYKPTDPRVRKTLCGAPVTQHDVRYGWQTDGVGEYVCCEKCVEIKSAAK